MNLARLRRAWRGLTRDERFAILLVAFLTFLGVAVRLWRLAAV